jgi:hypothetical protein
MEPCDQLHIPLASPTTEKTPDKSKQEIGWPPVGLDMVAKRKILAQAIS